MTDTTHDTLSTLGEIMRVAANRRLKADPHDDRAYTLHAIANEIAIALTLPDKASREYDGAGGYEE